MKVQRIGVKHRLLGEVYFFVLKMSWLQFVFCFVIVYLIINSLFAGLYLLDQNSILNAQEGSFIDSFIFSSQTFSTVGYGFLLPKSGYGQFLAIVENMAGILFMALVTGLTFAKFSRPTTHVIFTDKAVVADFDGIPTLMFRIGNGRDTSIVDAKLTVVTLRPQISTEGITMQRFVDLKLERDQSPFFLLTWTVMHKLDQSSPFYGFTEEDFRRNNVNLFVSLIGYDETFSETVHSGFRYLSDQIHFGKRFVDVVGVHPDGRRTLDFHHFHDIVS